MKYLITKSLLSLAFLAGSAVANTIPFVGIPTGGTKPVDVSATFVFAAPNQVTVTLNNNTSNPTDVIELISGLSFVLSNGSTAGSSLLSSIGTELTVNAETVNPPNPSGTYTVDGQAATGWNFSAPTSSSIFLTALGGSQPNHLIIGGSSNGTYVGGLYSNANGGIAGNDPHNPFLESGATFVITGLSGVNAATTATSAQFFFGTTPGGAFSPPGNTPSVPDSGSTLILSGLAMLGLGSIARRFGQRG